MTTVRTLRANPRMWGIAAGKVLLAICVVSLPSLPLSAKDPTHWLHAGAMPPGAIGSQRLLRGGPLLGHTQWVELRGPEGITLSARSGATYTTPHEQRLLAGLTLGPVYRFQAVGVPGYPEAKIFPTIELIDRLYPPPGKEQQFPLPVELTREDLRLAAQGAFITRVIYVENPKTALPVEQKDEQLWFEAKAQDDPLVLAGELGRPIAILRIGSRDLQGERFDPRFADPVELVDHTTPFVPQAD